MDVDAATQVEVEQQYLAAVTGWSLREVQALSRQERRSTLIFRNRLRELQKQKQPG